jgi:hypothetical protein
MRWLPIVRFARASTFDIPDDANMDGYALNIRWLTSRWISLSPSDRSLHPGATTLV